MPSTHIHSKMQFSFLLLLKHHSVCVMFDRSILRTLYLSLKLRLLKQWNGDIPSHFAGAVADPCVFNSHPENLALLIFLDVTLQTEVSQQ